MRLFLVGHFVFCFQKNWFCFVFFHCNQPWLYRLARMGRKFDDHSHPFILHPRFLQFLEIWFEKYGSRNLVGDNLVQEKWLTRKKGGLIP